MTADIPATFVAHFQNGQLGRFSFTPLPASAVSDLQQHLTRDARLSIPAAFEHAGEPVSIVQHEGLLYASTRLRSIALHTTFLLDAGFFTPCFNASPDAVPLNARWPVPEAMNLRFGIVASRSGACFDLLEARLFCTITEQTGFFRLPLPNVYEDAKVCLGTFPEATGRNAILGNLFLSVLAHFTAARWNADLVGYAGDGYKHLFRVPADGVRSGDDVTFAPPPADLVPHLRRCNHLSLEVLS